MTRQSESLQRNLFEEDEPRVELAVAQKVDLAALAWISTERNRPNIQIAKRLTRLKNPPVAVGQISVLIDPCA